MSDPNSVGGGNPGLAQPPVNPATQVAPGGQAGQGGSGIVGGPAGQPNPAGAGGGLQAPVSPSQLAAG